MTKVTEEIVTLYQVDGIFSNRRAGSGMCYCEHCRDNFREFARLDLPRTNDPRDPARREYIVWREQRLFELWNLWDSRIKAINPAASYIANAGGGALSPLDMAQIGRIAPHTVCRPASTKGLDASLDEWQERQRISSNPGPEGDYGHCQRGSGGRVALDVPSVALHEVVAVDFEA